MVVEPGMEGAQVSVSPAGLRKSSVGEEEFERQLAA